MSALLRQQEHVKGRQLVEQGDYQSALEIFKKALSAHGPHVGLISDTISVLYLMGRLEDCNFMTSRLQVELAQCRSEISNESLAKTLLFLGMIYEEQGQLHHALTTYENAAQVDSIEFTTKIRAQAQLLRLKTFLGLKLGLSELYHICLKAKTNLRGLNVELEHSLMLAEIVLFGPLMAKERIHKVLKSYQPNLYEIRLLVFDYAEEVLRQGLCVDDMCSLMKSIPFEQLDEFEKVIFTIITEPNLNLDPKDLQKISEKVPLMGLLRILILNIKSSKNKLLVTECRRKFLFHLEALNTESKAILLKKWERDLGQEHQILKYDGQLCRISLESHNFLVKKNSFMDKCFYLFRNQSVMSLEDFVQNVFEVQHDLNSYDRVRMALSRVNKELSSFTGVPKIFILSKTQVELNSSFIIAEND